MCDTTPHFIGRVKNIAWAIHQYSLTKELSCFILAYIDVQKLERFVVIIMYSKGCVLAKVNVARDSILQVLKNTLEYIPHSQAALFEHVKRALLQASFYGNQVTFVNQYIPDFRKWGGKIKTRYLVTILDNTRRCQ